MVKLARSQYHSQQCHEPQDHIRLRGSTLYHLAKPIDCGTARSKEKAMNTNEVLSGLNDAINAFHRLPVIENELKSITEDRDWVKLQLDEAQETITKLKAQIEAQAIDNAADKIKISSLENQITDLNNRNSDLQSSVDDLLDHTRTLRTDLGATHVRLAIALADKAALETKLAEAKSFGTRLAEKLADIGSLISQAPEVTESAPFPVSDPVELPSLANDETTDPVVSNINKALVDETGKGMVMPAPDVLVSAEPVKADVAAGCSLYRYW